MGVVYCHRRHYLYFTHVLLQQCCMCTLFQYSTHTTAVMHFRKVHYMHHVSNDVCCCFLLCQLQVAAAAHNVPLLQRLGLHRRISVHTHAQHAAAVVQFHARTQALPGNTYLAVSKATGHVLH